MKLLRSFTTALLLLGALGTSLSAQAQLRLTRPDGQAVTLSAEQLAALPRETVRAEAHGQTLTVQATPLAAVLRAGGIAPPEKVHGAALRQVLLATAADGYAVSFAWGELDPALGGRQVYLVQNGAGAELKDGEGPLRLVVPADARPARWVRQLQGLTLISPP